MSKPELPEGLSYVRIGKVGVDSGLMLIIDQAYIDDIRVNESKELVAKTRKEQTTGQKMRNLVAKGLTSEQILEKMKKQGV